MGGMTLSVSSSLRVQRAALPRSSRREGHEIAACAARSPAARLMPDTPPPHCTARCLRWYVANGLLAPLPRCPAAETRLGHLAGCRRELLHCREIFAESSNKDGT